MVLPVACLCVRIGVETLDMLCANEVGGGKSGGWVGLLGAVDWRVPRAVGAGWRMAVDCVVGWVSGGGVMTGVQVCLRESWGVASTEETYVWATKWAYFLGLTFLWFFIGYLR